MTTHLCATPSCDRPAPNAVICTRCITDLTTNLRHLATGPLIRTRIHLTGHLDGPPKPTRHHDHAPGLIADLDDVIARLTSTQGGIGILIRQAETALPYHAKASALAHHIRNAITTWARLLLHQNAHLAVPDPHTAAIAAWLAEQRHELAQLDAAGEMVDDIHRWVKRARATVDRAPDLTYVGPCGHLHITGEDKTVIRCAADLYGIADKPTVHCPTCGEDHDMATRRAQLLDVVDDQLATTQEIVRALPALLGEETRLAAATIRSWVNRGKLDQHGPHPRDPRERPRYRVGDVIDLVVKSRERTISKAG